MMANPKTGLFLATTPIFDVGDLQDQQQARELIIRLTQKINDIIISLNLKDTGYYIQGTFVNGQSYFPNPALTATTPQTPIFRQVFRKVFLFPQLPNAGTIVMAHGLTITNMFTFTRIYGVANDTTAPFNYAPIPSTTAAGNIIFVGVDAVNVYIETNFNATNYDQAYAIIEWIES